MKKSIYFFTAILLMVSLSISAGIKNDDHKIDIMGDISSEDRTKSYIENPIEIFKTSSSIDVYFYVNTNFKIDVYTNTGALLYTKTVNRYGGQILNINTKGWSAGKYKIVITNITDNKTAYGQFNI
ncbi:MAG: DUF3244 domain-containing protein [Prevotella sp.]|jgi:hypothetical protein|nr:DUF3244 domain-containing protein [Prevotella sp.]